MNLGNNLTINVLGSGRGFMETRVAEWRITFLLLLFKVKSDQSTVPNLCPELTAIHGFLW
jgi:hypothetical protein